MKNYLKGFGILSLLSVQLFYPAHSITIEKEYYIDKQYSAGSPLRQLNESSERILNAVSNTEEKEQIRTSNEQRRNSCRKNFLIPLNTSSNVKTSTALTPNPKPLPVFRIRCT